MQPSAAAAKTSDIRVALEGAAFFDVWTTYLHRKFFGDFTFLLLLKYFVLWLLALLAT